MTLNASPLPGTPPEIDPPTASPPVQELLAAQSTTAIPHACAPATVPEPTPAPASADRLAGIDIARALALAGMIAVHLLADVDDNGNMSVAFIVAAGKSAALFAVLAGVGIAFTTGRTRRPKGRRWLGAMAEVLVRGLLIGALGLAVGTAVHVDFASIILPYYGMLFIFALPFLRLPPAALAVCAFLIAIAMPILSHELRADLPAAPVPLPNLTFTHLMDAPRDTIRLLLLTGEFPALSWLAYILAGLAIGRAALQNRGIMARLTAIGISLAVLASTGSWFLMEPMGGSTALSSAAMRMMSRDNYTDLLVWGGDGVLPTNSPWWLAVMAPHTSTPFDLLFTMGIAVAVIGAALTLALVAPVLFRPLAKLGRMPLTVYTTHLLMLTAPFLPPDGAGAFVIHILVLGTFVLVWGHFFKRGPLEQSLWWIADHVDRLVGGPKTPRKAPTHALEGRR